MGFSWIYLNLISLSPISKFRIQISQMDIFLNFRLKKLMFCKLILLQNYLLLKLFAFILKNLRQKNPNLRFFIFLIRNNVPFYKRIRHKRIQEIGCFIWFRRLGTWSFGKLSSSGNGHSGNWLQEIFEKMTFGPIRI